MGTPIDVKYGEPTEVIDTWPEEKLQWIALNREANGNPEFKPLTIKASYIIGAIHGICESVECLLQNRDKYAIGKTYLPAYGVFASGVDLLGRCVKGESCARKVCLVTGFKWLVNSDYENVDDEYVLINTRNQEYSIKKLAALRHFAAHGQATNRDIEQDIFEVDYEILDKIHPYFSNALARYWNELIYDNKDNDIAEKLSNNLARANIIRFRSWPIFLSWSRFERDEFGKYHGIADIFGRFNWCVNESHGR